MSIVHKAIRSSFLRSIQTRVLFAAIAVFVFVASVTSAGAAPLSFIDSMNEVFGLHDGPSSPLAPTATYTVTNTADNGAGSLRQAVLDANGTVADDVIAFNIPTSDSGCNAGTGVCTIALTTGEIVIANNGSLTINGTGANRLTISGNNSSRIFFSGGPVFTVSGVTLTGGNGVGTNSGDGGAILYNSFVGGRLVLSGVVVTGNTASFTGGGVYIASNNSEITNSTISSNSASFGGGLRLTGATTITNSTISGNSATGTNGGGGIYNQNSGTMLRNSTIAGNTAGTKAGGLFTYDIAAITNTIVAGNTGGSTADIQLIGAVTTTGYNLIGNNSGATTAFPAGNPNANNDIVGTSGAPIDPLLDALANYGGTVPTRRLQTTSPAIDKGSLVAGVTTDERGFIRPYDDLSVTNATGGNGSDIGAFELAPPTRHRS